MSLVVISIVDPRCAVEPGTEAVRQILDHWGYEHYQFIDNGWAGWASKQLGFIRICKELQGQYTHVMLMDARDVVVLASAAEVMKRFFAFNHPWVYAAEPFIWSEGSFKPSDYPPSGTPYRYLNAGAAIGELEHVNHWFDVWTDGGNDPPIYLPTGDQDWVAGHFLDSYPEAIKLDNRCELFQCCCGSRVGDRPFTVEFSRGYTYNRTTETYPLVIHGNGGDDITRDDWKVLWRHYFDPE